MKKLLAAMAGALALAGAAAPAVADTGIVPGYDSVTLSAIPSDARVVGGYVGGRWPTYDSVVADFPQAAHLSIAVNASEITHNGKPVNCLDTEPGDAVPSQDRAWVLAEIHLGEAHPCVYTSLSEMPQVKAAVAGLPALFWMAWFNGDPALFGFDAHQWTDTCLGRVLDCDSFSTKFLLELGLIQPVLNQHYERYPDVYFRVWGVHARERHTILSWDSNHCRNPVRRAVCKRDRNHLQLLLKRDLVMFQRYDKTRRDEFFVGGRIQGMLHRLRGSGVVNTWL